MMPSNLYVDTATSDRWRFPRGGEPVPDTEQPFMVRLAWLLEAEDGHTLREVCHLIRLPEGARMASEAQHHTGVYEHHLIARGLGLASVVVEFAEALAEASLVVAHSWQFHKQVLEREFRYVGKPEPDWPMAACAMISATNIVQIPRKQPGGGYLWPSFAQCAERFCGGPLRLTMNPVDDGIQRARAVRVFWQNIQRSKDP